MLRIRPIAHADLKALHNFTDREIGVGYYTSSELEDIFKRSQKSGRMYSLLLTDENDIKGVRISFPPGQWTHGKGKNLSSEVWPHPLAETAYFQSIFLSPSVQGEGWGGRISAEALRILKTSGAKGVVCHSWKESPNNSSTRYLTKLGFKTIAEYPNYWKEVDYNCTRCKKPPCLCTAQEMYLDLERTP